MGGRPFKSPGELGKEEAVTEIPLDVPTYPDVLRELSVAMQITGNDQGPCCCSLFLP